MIGEVEFLNNRFCNIPTLVEGRLRANRIAVDTDHKKSWVTFLTSLPHLPPLTDSVKQIFAFNRPLLSRPGAFLRARNSE